jgi:beta-lactamase superfamily II metal-dependent hydrolase
MIVQIFDVEHGNCSLITTPNGKHVLIDCGHNDTTGFRPSSFLISLGLNGKERRLTKLVIANVDQDHISDLPNVYNKLRPEVLSRNKYINRGFLNDVKDEITEAMEAYLQMHETYIYPANPDLGGVTFSTFHHDPAKFSDTNDLSFVSFVQYQGLRMIFPGDLSAAAWLAFLGNANFVKKLQETNIFVASHHGREDGYCPEIFKYCQPQLIVLSDCSIKYETQTCGGLLRHATGIFFDDSNFRKILSTRNNGMITFWTPVENPTNWKVRITKA